MTIHEAAEDLIRAYKGVGPTRLDVEVRMRLLDTAIERYRADPSRRAEYPAPVRDGEHELSGPMQGIPLAEIVVRSDGGPWAVHNQPCAVCGQRTAILDLNEGVMHPCWACQRLGWDLTQSRPHWWQKRFRSRLGVSE